MLWNLLSQESYSSLTTRFPFSCHMIFVLPFVAKSLERVWDVTVCWFSSLAAPPGSSQSPLPPWTLLLVSRSRSVLVPLVFLTIHSSVMILPSYPRLSDEHLASWTLPRTSIQWPTWYFTWLCSHANSVLTVSSCSVWRISSFSLQWLPTIVSRFSVRGTLK